MPIELPRKLKKEDRIGIVAPASPFLKEVFEKGVERLQDKSFIVERNAHLEDQNGYLAGTDEVRAQAVMDFFKKDEIDAIWCARGGYGTLRILDRLDYEEIRKNPKVFCGYSDITALLLAMWKKTGMITFHGPMVTSLANFSESEEEKFWHFWETGEFQIEGGPWEIVQEGKAFGTLLGGNLTVLCSLIGTSYFPDMKNAILFLEDTGEALYRMDRLLTQLRLTGVLQSISGLILGDFSGGPSQEEIVTVVKEICGNIQIPIVAGFPIGHEGKNVVMPVGVKVMLDTKSKKLWSESAVLR